MGLDISTAGLQLPGYATGWSSPVALFLIPGHVFERDYGEHERVGGTILPYSFPLCERFRFLVKLHAVSKLDNE